MTANDAGADAAPDDPSWLVWAGDTEGWAIGWDVVIDPAGSSYLAGRFGGDLRRGPINVHQAIVYEYPNGDGLVAKVGSTGKVAWATQLGAGSGASDAKSVVVSPSGEIWVAGYFTGTATFGPTTLVSKGLGDGFVARLSKSGQVLWAKAVGAGTGTCYVHGLSLAAGGGVLLAGSFMGTAQFDGKSLTSAGLNDGFVAAFDAKGQLSWVAQVAGTDREGCYSVATDSQGKIWIGGQSRGASRLGSVTLPSKENGGFVAQLSSSGRYAWALRAPSDTGSVSRLAIAHDGTLRVTGIFGGASARFGKTVVNRAGPLTGYVASVDPTVPQFSWAVGLGSGQAGGVAVDKRGETYVAAWVQNRASVVHLGTTGKIVKQLRTAGATGQGGAWGVRLDGAGGVRVTGAVRSKGQLTFRTRTVSATSDSHLFLWSFPTSWL